MASPPIDCCAQPSLTNRRKLHDSSHASEDVMQCACETYWFHRFHEWTSFDGPDDLTTWYTRLTAEEAGRLLTTDKPDLGFLTAKPSIMIDGNGVQHVPGQPDRTYGGT